MKTYYAQLDLQPAATPVQIQAMFRRYCARYRPTLTIEALFNDVRFLDHLNAYLTLSGKQRQAYDDALNSPQADDISQPRPYEDYSVEQQHLLMARIAFWRREIVEAIHQLRLVLEQNPDSAAAWALLGEIYLTVGRLADGIHAYQRATNADPDTPLYAERLQHARDVQAGKMELQVEVSPEEELLREERRQRWAFMLGILIISSAIISLAFLRPVTQGSLGFMNIPWSTVALQMAGVLLLFLGLGYGRVVRPFEQAMVWTSIAAGDRGRILKLPYGLLFFAMAAASLWIALLGMLIMAIMDDEWPAATSFMIGSCVLLDLGLVATLYFADLPWGTALLFGGNGLVIAAMLGWFIGSLGAPRYE